MSYGKSIKLFLADGTPGDIITAESMQLDTLSTESECAKALLQERRTALISASVTGRKGARDEI